MESGCIVSLLVSLKSGILMLEKKMNASQGEPLR